MTQAFWVFPALAVKPARKRALKGVYRKYDHWQMLQDRIAGMSWADIAKKHGIDGPDGPRLAYGAALNSNATKRLHPEEVKRLESVGRVRSQKA
jgi:hypothetical protein